MYVLSVGGVLTVGGLLDIGYGMRGVIMQHGGSLIVNALNIGFNAAGFGVYTQLAGTVRATTIQLGCGATKDARGEYYLSGDASLYVGTMRVGFEAYSTNTFCQVGGTVVVSNSLQIGGALLVTNGSNIIIGYDATGTFLLGNSNTAGRIDTVVPGTNWGSLAVGRNAGSSSQGLFRGWGALHLNQIWLTLKGKIVADGYGQERTLDLSNLNSTSPYYTADPDNNGTAGWYAQNKGRLLLKPIAITAATYQWGHIGFEQTSKTNFVNSARLTFAGTTSGAVSGALLATDRSDVPAGIIHPIGVWDFSGGTFGTAQINFRYDHVAAATGKRSEAELKVFQYRDSAWVNVTAGAANTATKKINTTALSGLGTFAIGWAPVGTAIFVL